MTLPRWIAPGALAFLALWLVLLAGGRSGLLRDPGTFWHTRTGELILTNGIVRTDPFTFTFPGSWWPPSQWLAEVCMALAYRAGGFDVQLLGTVVILAATFAFLAVRLLRTGLHPVAVGMLIALSLAAGGSHFHVRPHIVTIAGMALTAALLTDCDAGRLRLRDLFRLVPFYLLWANVHGGYLGGFGSLIIVATGWCVFRVLGRPSPVGSRRDAGLLALLVLCCGLVSLVNPYGLEIWKMWRVIMGEPILKEIIKEHRPFDISEPYAVPLLGFAAVYLFVLAGVPWRSARASWLLPVVWMLQSVERCRHGTLFVVVGLAAIAAMWPHTRWAVRLARSRPDFYEPDAPPVPRPWWATWLLPALAVLLSLGLQVGGVRVPVVGAGWAQHSSKHWPLEVLDAIKANEPGPLDPHYRVFNDYIDGGFLIHHAPGYRVFVDDRCEVFGGPWLWAFVVASHPDTTPEARAATMERWQAEYGRFDFALTRTGTAFDDYFRTAPGWECVKSSKTASFYRRGDLPR